MKKIIALGGGRYDGEITNIIEEICDLSDAEEPKMLFLPTAGHDDMEGDEILLELFENAGCETDFLLLTDEELTEEDIAESILSADIIYVGGGNLQFLMDTWKKTGVIKYLKQAYENGTVLSGLSSGAMCWFSMGYDDCGEDHSFVFIECTGILPGCVCPHYESDNWQSFKERIKETDENGIAIEDGAALFFIEDRVLFNHGNDGGEAYVLPKDQGHKEINISKDPEILQEIMYAQK